MDNKDIKRRDVMDFDKFTQAYDQVRKAVMLKQGENADPGAHPIKGEDLYVRNDANPYKAMGIPHNEELSDINPKYMNANQVDVFHNRKLTPEEKKKIDDVYGHQVVTHHQMAFILDESISDEVKMGPYPKMKLSESVVTDFDEFEFNPEDMDKTMVKEAEEEGEKKKEEEKPKELTEEDYKNMYNGKTVILNGDNAKITDDEGVAKIKSESNEMRMSWKQAHEIMSKKGGTFRSEKAKEEEKPKEEEKKEDKKKEK